MINGREIMTRQMSKTGRAQAGGALRLGGGRLLAQDLVIVKPEPNEVKNEKFHGPAVLFVG